MSATADSPFPRRAPPLHSSSPGAVQSLTRAPLPSARPRPSLTYRDASSSASPSFLLSHSSAPPRVASEAFTPHRFTRSFEERTLFGSSSLSHSRSLPFRRSLPLTFSFTFFLSSPPIWFRSAITPWAGHLRCRTLFSPLILPLSLCLVARSSLRTYHSFLLLSPPLHFNSSSRLRTLIFPFSLFHSQLALRRLFIAIVSYSSSF